ncbi:PD40 domain-containing protein [Brumimicrobium aurantiacum]|uniref:Uncharacterized protein n=1 Tax=Brumimicrobium aurantiacum TaxID=1737063 RepID=A0A3E1EWW0_9FLAO|nr:PD40 domain-containing protein [Brumimicrobium aurantiacum]RFC54012.1 hypothetical protein DXU93_10760 [Brumimicrobium aurantiacum]
MNLVYTKSILTAILLSFSIVSFTQDLTPRQLEDVLKTGTEKELVQVNTSLMINNSYYHGFLTAEKLLEFDAENPNYNYRYGFALLNISDNFDKAIPHLKIAVSNVTKNFDMTSKNENDAPLEALYFMGEAYHLSNQLDKALENYQTFLKLSKNENPLNEKAELKILQCKVAKRLIANPSDFEVKNVGEKINTVNPEYSPIVSLDGSALYFTSRRLYPDSSNIMIKEPGTNLFLEDIYVSYKDNNDIWSEPQLLPFCEPNYNEATVSISADERSIYVFKDQTGNGDLYYSKLESNIFKNLNPIKDKAINTKHWETHITVSPDGRRKYFVSDREGGFGGRDIYVIEKLSDGTWTDPKNLGPTINTKYDEDSPFIAIDNRTMFFSSNGEESMGGFDIFSSKLDEDYNWSKPVNLGHPLNTTNDDIYYTTNIDGTTGYYTSYRKGGYGEKDIYEVTKGNISISNVKVYLAEIITNELSNMPEDIVLKVKCLDCDEAYEYIMYSKITDGTFYASLEPCKTYEISLRKANSGPMLTTEKITTHCSPEYEEIYRQFHLNKAMTEVVKPQEQITTYAPLIMKHYFGYNKNKLDPNEGVLKIFLDSINSQFERGRTNFDININASASKVPTGSFDSNQDLANKRAENVKDFLTDYFNSLDQEYSVNIQVNKTFVSGPDYSADFKNNDKYIPYQYVEIFTNGVNNISSEDVIEMIESTNVEVIKDKNGGEFTNRKFMYADYNFHIVIGSFFNLEFAKRLNNSLIEKGYDSEIITLPNDLKLVTTGKSDKIKEANNLLKQAKEEVEQSAWILNLKK